VLRFLDTLPNFNENNTSYSLLSELEETADLDVLMQQLMPKKELSLAIEYLIEQIDAAETKNLYRLTFECLY
jgi:hypothetical protein